MSQKVVTETVTRTVTVDDLTGKELGKNGWTLVRRRDGASLDFQSLSVLLENLNDRRSGFGTLVNRLKGRTV